VSQRLAAGGNIDIGFKKASQFGKFGEGQGTIVIANASVPSTVNLAGAGILYVEDGALKRIGKLNALLPQHRREGPPWAAYAPEIPPASPAASPARQRLVSLAGRRTADVADGQTETRNSALSGMRDGAFGPGQDCHQR
jgi:hypothetical protein